MADFREILFNLMSIQVEVPCPMWSALYSTRLEVYLNKFSTTARKAWPSTKGLIQSAKHASSQEVLFCQHRWKEQKTHNNLQFLHCRNLGFNLLRLHMYMQQQNKLIPKHRFSFKPTEAMNILAKNFWASTVLLCSRHSIFIV